MARAPIPSAFPDSRITSSMVTKRTESADELIDILCCPVCRGSLGHVQATLVCQGQCQTVFPIVDGRPILINERSSVFTIDDFVTGRPTYFREESTVRRIAKKALPDFNVDIKSSLNFSTLRDLLKHAHSNPRVLVVGGGILGIGMQELADDPLIKLVETDVSLGPRTRFVCDAHDLPFADESFDGVVIQAVLEHVIDPERAVSEIWRTLRTGGYVYSETPFMQQVHGGKFDFTRYTNLGHRRLFRRFEQVSTGPVGGPALALAWSYRYFLLSLVSSTGGRAFMQGFARLTAFWLKYLDKLLIDRPATFDAASAFYFLGRKSALVLSDAELLASYRGG